MSSSPPDSADCRTHVRFTQLRLKSLRIIRQWLDRHIEHCEVRDEILAIAEEKAWKSFATLKNTKEFTPWFMTIVQNTARDYFRHKKIRESTHEVFDEKQHSGTGTYLNIDLNIDIEVMLGILNLKERAAVVMSSNKYSIKEIADEIGCTEAAAQKMIYRAKHKIRKKFPEYGA